VFGLWESRGTSRIAPDTAPRRSERRPSKQGEKTNTFSWRGMGQYIQAATDKGRNQDTSWLATEDRGVEVQFPELFVEYTLKK
jgi:hypothetical protein